MENNVFEHLEKIEFPPNFNPAFIGSSSVRGGCSTNRIVCPRSSIPTVARLELCVVLPIEIIEDQ